MANAAAMTSLLGSKAAVAVRPTAFTGKRTSRVQVHQALQNAPAHAQCRLERTRMVTLGVLHLCKGVVMSMAIIQSLDTSLMWGVMPTWMDCL